MLAICICKYSLKSCPGDPSVLSEILRGLPQCLKLNSGTVKHLHADHGRHFPRTFQFTIHCHPIILRRILQSSYRGKAPLVMKRSWNIYTSTGTADLIFCHWKARSCFSIHFHVHDVKRIKTVTVQHSSRYTTYKSHLWMDPEYVNYRDSNYKFSARNFIVF